MLKKAVTFLAAMLVISMLIGCQQKTDMSATKIFTDSCGREVTVPVNIERVAVTGSNAQIIVFALCPDRMVGFANDWDGDEGRYLDEKYYDVPVLGQLYGGKGNLNPEALLATNAQVVLDIGDSKKTIREDMDELTEQVGIPFIHIDGDLGSYGDTYRMLGELLGMEKEADILAKYCEQKDTEVLELADRINKKDILFVLGEEGKNVVAEGSKHALVIDLICNNLAKVDEPSSKGIGNEVDMEQILSWNPACVIFDKDSIYDSVSEDSVWKQVDAIKNGNYYKVPYGPNSFMGFPNSVQRYLGVIWLSELIYPDECSYDLQKEITEYYRMFYHVNLSDEDYNRIMKNSLAE